MAALLRQLDFHGSELAIVDKELAVEALRDPAVARLMTIPGVDAIAGISIVAAVGDFTRFDDPNKLVAYVGLNPRVRQSGNSAPVHGRISKAGRAHVRGVLVEAAWSASPGTRPAARVLSARQSPPRIPESRRRHRPQDDRARLAPGHQGPGLRLRPPRAGHPQARKLELAAGAPSRRGNYRLPGAAYNDKQRRNEEKIAVEKAEHAYEVLVAHWQPKRPTPA